MPWPASPPPRILSEDLVPVAEPLAVALRPGEEGHPADVTRRAARAVFDDVAAAAEPWPVWLTPHQVPAARRLCGSLSRYGGAVLADAVGLGKSYVALAVALRRRQQFALIVPAVLVPQWRALLARMDVAGVSILTHEALSVTDVLPPAEAGHLVVVDEAHRFRNPETKRYQTLARWTVGRRLLLITATPVHNRLGDLFHLFRLFLRDHALAALGIPSLRRAALGEGEEGMIAAAAARLIVARSRARVQSGYRENGPSLVFPACLTHDGVRMSPVSDSLLEPLIAGIRKLRSGGSAAPLLRLMLLKRLGSSVAAFRESLLRHEAYLDLATQAGREGRRLSPGEFQRCFPRTLEADLQLALFPLLLDAAGSVEDPDEDRRELERLRAVAAAAGMDDPKAQALDRILRERPAKTIVFTESRATVRHLLRRLHAWRVAAVFGTSGEFASGTARRGEVLRAFAPLAQGAAAPPRALTTDVLIATDLLSEGLNLQDAERVVHYDLPWSPARLAQRVGRIDRLGSPHAAIETVTFLPPKPLAVALRLEERLARKATAQASVGSDGRLDWCDRLAALVGDARSGAGGQWAAVAGIRPAVVLVVRIAAAVELIVIEGGQASVDPTLATSLLEQAARSTPVPVDRAALDTAIVQAAPLIRDRIKTVQSGRWRAADRDRLARRLIPWVLTSARRAARRREAVRLAELDALVSRLASGMTAGEELQLEALLARREPLTVAALLAWHRQLPGAATSDDGLTVELVAALQIYPEE